MKPAPIASKRVHRRVPNGKTRARMSALGLAIALAAGVSTAQAAGLGRLSLLSGIGQPLRAEIELTSIGRDESNALSARLASADAYSQAGIEYGGGLSNLRFSIQRRSGGQPYVLVTSTQAVNETFLDILVELNWGAGRLVREYTMLLDPPETRAARAEVDPGQAVVSARAPATPPRRAPREASGTRSAGPGAARPAVMAPSSSSTGADYVVQNGDTALSISRASKPEGTSLEQMLAALYRDNPQAFNGNINRLMAGATVKLPDAATSQAISGADAGRIVAQSGNFGRYRERLAQAAGETPAARSTTPQTSGRLAPAVQDNSAPSTEARDRLQLTRPDAAKGAAAAPPAARNGTGGPTAEEVAAKDRELQETRTRLAQLQKNVTDLQDLLKLKNQTLADLQKGAAAKGGDKADAANATTTSPSTAVVLAPTPAAPPEPVAAPVAAQPAPIEAPPAAPSADAAPAAPAAQPPAPVPPPAPVIVQKMPAATPDTAWYEDLLDNTLVLIGIGVLVLLIIGYGVYTMLRRRKLSRFEDSIFVDNSVLHANSVFGTTGGQSVDTANSGFHSNFIPAGGSLPEQSEVDPVAEADVYIAYGREAQAEEILKEALRADAGRHAVRLKLLEIYARRGDAKTFETLASELYAATGGQGNDWSQAAQLGLTVDPRNPLYTQSGTAPVRAAAPAMAPVMTPSAAVVSPPPAAMTATVPAAAMQAVARASGLGRNLQEAAAAPSSDHIRTEPMARVARAAADSPMDLDFDLGVGGQRPAPLSQAPAPATPSLSTPAAPPAPPTMPSLDPHALDPTHSMIEPFTASAFGATDTAIRTAVNLPAFRARVDQPSPAPAPSSAAHASDGFTASDIFGSSIIADGDAYSETPRAGAPTPQTSNFRADLDHNEFAKTEPFDAFSKINLDLDQPSFAAPGVESDFGDKTEVWQAMATKLDLALAYNDIGDKDGARELLDEVVRSGDETQAQRAKHLITQLN